jgi:uncharacterized protein YgbK (DUF1537 family)
MGNLFVGRQPLHESPMKDHPLTPMRDSNLMRLLAPQVTRPVGLIDRLTVARGPEAVRAALAKLAEGRGPCGHRCRGRRRPPRPRRGLSRHGPFDRRQRAWPCRCPRLMIAPRGRLPTAGIAAAPPPTPGVVLSGSCSAMTRRQVAAYEAKAPAFRLDPIAIAEGRQTRATPRTGSSSRKIRRCVPLVSTR